MASSIWIFSSWRSFDEYYKYRIDGDLPIHPIKRMYLYKLDSTRRLILLHDSPPKSPLKDVMGYTIEHFITEKQFKKAYPDKAHLIEISPSNFTFNPKTKSVHIMQPFLKFFKRSALRLNLDRIWWHRDSIIEYKKPISYPFFDRDANRICFVMPFYLNPDPSNAMILNQYE